MYESVLCELYICMSLLLWLMFSEVQRQTVVLLYVSNTALQLIYFMFFTFRNINSWPTVVYFFAVSAQNIACILIS